MTDGVWSAEEMLSLDPEAMTALAANISVRAQAAMRPIIGGQHPGVQSAVLADLVSFWLAGHAPILRDDMLEMLVDLIRKLVPESEKQMFGEAGHPNKDVEPAPAAMIDRLTTGVSEWSCGHVAGAMCAQCWQELAQKAHKLAEENLELRSRS